MSNLIKKRQIFSSESDSDGEEYFQNHKNKQNSSSEPALAKKLKKANDDEADEFEKKLEVVNKINAIKKDSMLKYLEEEDEKLSPKTNLNNNNLNSRLKKNNNNGNKTISKENNDKQAHSKLNVDADDHDDVKEEEEEYVEDNEDEDEEEEEGIDSKNIRQHYQNYDQESTNDKENSFDGLYSFKDDDDFYIQANKNRQGETQQEKDLVKLVKERNGKIISKARGYIFTVICFKSHVFDADIENIIKRWCPQCHILHQEVAQYAIQQEGELQSQFFQPKLHFRCKFFHRWVTPEMNCVKSKVWCPKCPEVLNLMINHHHKGIVSDDEKILQISEQAELVADGYQVTNPSSELQFEILKDLYFILLVPLTLYNRYLQSFRVEDQVKQFKKKLALMHPDNNSHPLSQKVTEKLYKLFEHLLESDDEEEEEEEDQDQVQVSNKKSSH